MMKPITKYGFMYPTVLTISFLIIVGSLYSLTTEFHLFSSSQIKAHFVPNVDERKTKDEHSSLEIAPVDHQLAVDGVLPRKKVIFVIGDSHIYHLQKGIADGTVESAREDFNTRAQVILYGIPGATVDRLRASMSLINLLRSKRPDIVFLHIGGNDADSVRPVDQVCENILTYVGELKTVYGVKQVLLSEQFYRKNIRHLPNNVYDKKVIDLNKALEFGKNHTFLRHITLTDSKDEILSTDGVHLNSYGQQLFYLSIVNGLKPYQRINSV